MLLDADCNLRQLESRFPIDHMTVPSSSLFPWQFLVRIQVMHNEVEWDDDDGILGGLIDGPDDAIVVPGERDAIVVRAPAVPPVVELTPRKSRWSVFILPPRARDRAQ